MAELELNKKSIHTRPLFGTQGRLNFDFAIDIYTTTLLFIPFCNLFYRFICGLVHARGADPPHLLAVNNIKVRPKRPPPLLDTGGASLNLRSQTIRRIYVGQYGTYLQGNQPGFLFVSPEQLSMAGTFFTRRHRHHANGHYAPKDYPLGPSTYTTDGDPGSNRPSGR